MHSILMAGEQASICFDTIVNAQKVSSRDKMVMSGQRGQALCSPFEDSNNMEILNAETPLTPFFYHFEK